MLSLYVSPRGAVTRWWFARKTSTLTASNVNFKFCIGTVYLNSLVVYILFGDICYKSGPYILSITSTIDQGRVWIVKVAWCTLCRYINTHKTCNYTINYKATNAHYSTVTVFANVYRKYFYFPLQIRNYAYRFRMFVLIVAANLSRSFCRFGLIFIWTATNLVGKFGRGNNKEFKQ